MPPEEERNREPAQRQKKVGRKKIHRIEDMTTDELPALTRATARAGTRLHWDRPIVAYKHCIGDRVKADEPLYRIHACERLECDFVAAAANAHSCYRIDGRPPTSEAAAQ